MTAVRRWSATIPAPCAWLTANTGGHYIVKARLVAEWRGAAKLAAISARFPQGLDRVRIDAVAHFRGRPPVRDRSNLWPTIKAVVDGLGPERIIRRRNVPVVVAPGYGLIPDDDDGHLDGPYITIGEPLPALPFGNAGQLVLIVTDLSGGEP